MADETKPRGTRQIKVPADLADMLAWIVDIEGGSVAEFLDPIVRPAVEARYARIRPAVEAIESAKRAYAVPELGTPVG